MADRTLFDFQPFAAEFPSSNFPQLQLVNRRPVLAFDADTDETCYWTFTAPQGILPPVDIRVSYIMESATVNEVQFQTALECITDGDATDLDAATSFDSDNSSGAVTVPGTAGFLDQFTITLSNDDSITAADYCRLRLYRDADHANDDAADDCYVLSVEFMDDGG